MHHSIRIFYLPLTTSNFDTEANLSQCLNLSVCVYMLSCFLLFLLNIIPRRTHEILSAEHVCNNGEICFRSTFGKTHINMTTQTIIEVDGSFIKKVNESFALLSYVVSFINIKFNRTCNFASCKTQLGGAEMCNK